jgi:hypothetical protein
MEIFDVNLQNIKKNALDAGDSQFFINFICKLEGWKSKCKNLHWAAPKKNIHKYLDDFLGILGDFQDSLAEDYMGILGQMQPNAVKPIQDESLNAFDFIRTIKADTLEFYSQIPQDTVYKGITSECEAFIHNINKYDYLFHLCDVRIY